MNEYLFISILSDDLLYFEVVNPLFSTLADSFLNSGIGYILYNETIFKDIFFIWYQIKIFDFRR